MSDGPSRAEIDDFVRANDVDDRAAADLKDCPPDVQRKVLARGELSSARNPSAALLARIRDARACGGSSSGGAQRGSADVEDFIKSNDVDESAADSLRSSSPEVQRVVLSRGELKTARNPSSALLARIRDAKAGVGGGGDSQQSMAMNPCGAQPGLGPCGMPGGYAMSQYVGYGPPPGYAGMYPGGAPGGGPAVYGSGYPMYPGAGMYPGYPSGYPSGAYSGAPGMPGGMPGMGPGGYGGAYGMAGYGPQYSSQYNMGAGAPLPLENGAAVEGSSRRRKRSRSRSRGRSSSSSSSRSPSRSRDRRRRKKKSRSRGRRRK